jgi:site-specific DNA-cytosine methylase
MKLLNLFSGTDSVAKPWRDAGHAVISVDIDPRYNPEICEDILQLSYCKLSTPDVIWASPPCDQYARCRTRAKTPRNLALADSLVAKAIEIIKYFSKLNPELVWFVENGQTTMLWGRPVGRGFTNYITLDYCQYGGPGYRKRTRIAHSDNLHWNPRPLCDPRTCGQCVDGKHILTAQQGPGKKKGVRDKYDTCTLDTLHALPRELTEEILRICQEHMWEFI